MKAFSILEMTVSMAITAIIMVMLSNVLITTVSISQRSLARSFVREEISLIADRISSDIRAAEQVSQCQGNIDSLVCELSINGQLVVWTVCSDSGINSVCKRDGSDSGDVIYQSSSNVNITVFDIQPGFESGTSIARRNILVTIAGDHALEGLNIKNVVRQTAVSTRNYLL